MTFERAFSRAFFYGLAISLSTTAIVWRLAAWFSSGFRGMIYRMSLIQLIVVLVVVGVILYVINSVLPVDATIKKIINVVVILVVCLWLLEVFGVFGGFRIGVHR